MPLREIQLAATVGAAATASAAAQDGEMETFQWGQLILLTAVNVVSFGLQVTRDWIKARRDAKARVGDAGHEHHGEGGGQC